MKNLLNKILLVALVAVLGGVLSGCNPEPEMKQFSVSFKGYGPGYVSVMVTQPNPTTVAYVVSETPISTMNPTLLNVMGTQTTFYTEGEQQLLDFPVEANTKYYVYLVGLLGENFSKMYEYEFETGEFVFDQLATVIGVSPDGYDILAIVAIVVVAGSGWLLNDVHTVGTAVVAADLYAYALEVR